MTSTLFERKKLILSQGFDRPAAQGALGICPSTLFRSLPAASRPHLSRVRALWTWTRLTTSSSSQAAMEPTRGWGRGRGGLFLLPLGLHSLHAAYSPVSFWAEAGRGAAGRTGPSAPSCCPIGGLSLTLAGRIPAAAPACLPPWSCSPPAEVAG